jgi:hypothetical protein
MSSSPRSINEDLDRVLLFLRRSLAYWRRALLVIVIGSLIVVPFVFTRPRSWRSETVILYQETMRSSDLTGGGDTGDGNVRRVGARLREVLLSRASLEPIIKDLQVTPKTDPRSKLEAVEEMRKHISFRAREGDTFEIAYEAATPEEAKQVTTRLGECIIQEASVRRADRAKVLKEFLTVEADSNAADLRKKEAELAKFVALHPALAARLRQPNQQPMPGTAPGGGAALPTTSDPVLASLEFRASRIERQLARAQGARVEPAPAPAKYQPPPDSPELVAARRDLADKLSRFTDKHPDVTAARGRLRTAEEAQAASNAAALEAFNAAAAGHAHPDDPAPKNAADEAALRQQLMDLQAQAASRRAALRGDAGAPVAATTAVGDVVPGSVVDLELEFRRLEREVIDGRERQRTLDDKLFKASINASSVMSDRNIQVSVLDPAFLPIHPTSKPRSTLLAGLLLVVLLLALGAALISTKLDDRIYDQIDLERLDILPIVGVIPRQQLPPKQ